MAPNVDKETLLHRIKETVLAIAPGADVILYGSRARGDAEADSDWDVLVLTEEEPDWDKKYAILDALYELEIETRTVIVPIVHSRSEWNTPLRQATPFHANVSMDGITL